MLSEIVWHDPVAQIGPSVQKLTDKQITPVPYMGTDEKFYTLFFYLFIH